MALRKCIVPTCPELTTKSRCTDHDLDKLRAHPDYRAAQREARRWIGRPCPECGHVMTRDRRHKPTVDHIVRLEDGGVPGRENLRIVCWKCNRAKG